MFILLNPIFIITGHLQNKNLNLLLNFILNFLFMLIRKGDFKFILKVHKHYKNELK
jgi:hypothetical protein